MDSLIIAGIQIDGCEEMGGAVINNVEDFVSLVTHKLISFSTNHQNDIHKLLKVLFKILMHFSNTVQPRLECMQCIEELKSFLKGSLVSTLQSQQNSLYMTSCFLVLNEYSGHSNAEEIADMFSQISTSSGSCGETKERIYQLTLSILNTKIKLVSDSFQLILNCNWNEKNISYLLYQQIVDLCMQSTQAELKGLQLLGIWLQKVTFERTINMSEMQSCHCICDITPLHGNIFSLQNKQHTSIVEIINKNWENQHKGASKLVMECVKLLLNLNPCLKHASTFVKEMLRSVMNSGWNTKRIYLQLQASNEFLHPTEVLELYPEIPMKLLNGLQSSGMNMYSTNVYKSMLTFMSTHQWLKYFAPVFEKGLSSENKTLQDNLLKLWISCTLNQKQELFGEIYNLTGDTCNGLLSKLFILREARIKGLVNIGHYEFKATYLRNLYNFEHNLLLREASANREMCPYYDQIIDGIFHSRNDIRSECFALLANPKKLSDPITVFESTLIKIFIGANLNIDSSSFRMSLFKSFKRICKRLFSLMAARIRKDEHYCEAEIKRQKCNNREQLDNAFDGFDICVDLFHWLINAFVANLVPCGSYQRKVSTLHCYWELLRQLHDRTAEPHLNNLSRCSEERISKDTIPALLSYCTDECEDVRMMSLDLLRIVTIHYCSLDATSESLWLVRAFNMCNSPEANLSQSGATVFKAMQCLNKIFTVVLLNYADENLLTSTIIDQDNTLVLLLFHILESQLSKARDNILRSSYDNPMHGVICAISSTLLSEEYQSYSRSSFVKDFVKKLFSLYQHIVHFCLQCLRPSGFQKDSPSFSEMDSALRQLFSECVQRDLSLNENMEVGIQMILSSCWLCMKACCLSVASIVEKFVKIMDLSLMKVGMEGIVIHVLLNTRHKGAMEAASLALSRLSEVIDSTKNCNIPNELLKLQLDSIIGNIDKVCESSLTRRAAGYAMIFSSTCESSKVLSVAVAQSLFDVVEKNDKLCSSVSDSPVVVSLHTLRAMLLNSRISSYLLPLYSQLVDICLEAFDSQQWVMRNASLQLFGALVTALVGQKKEKDDTATFNSISITDFTVHHGDIIKKLSAALIRHVHPLELMSHNTYDQLSKIFTSAPSNTDSRKEFQIHCSTLPILSLLSRMEAGTKCSSVLENLRSALIPCLAHPVWTVRRLCATCIVKLSLKTEIPVVTSKMINLIYNKSADISSNLMHGLLLILSFAVDYYPHLDHDAITWSRFREIREYFKFNPILYSLHFIICSRTFSSSDIPYYNILTGNLHYLLCNSNNNDSADFLMASLKSGNVNLVEEVVEYLSDKDCATAGIAEAVCECYNYISICSKLKIINILVKCIDGNVVTTSVLSDKIVADMMDSLDRPELDDCSLNFVILSAHWIKHHYLGLDNIIVSTWCDKFIKLDDLFADQQVKMAAASCLKIMLPLTVELKYVHKLVSGCLHLLHDENEAVRTHASSAVAATLALTVDANPTNSIKAFVMFLFRFAFNNRSIDVITSLFQFCDLRTDMKDTICLYKSDVGHVYGEFIHTGKYISNVMPYCFTEYDTFSCEFKTALYDFVCDKISIFKCDLIENINPMAYFLMDKNRQLNISVRLNCLKFLSNLIKMFNFNVDLTCPKTFLL